MNTKRLRHLLLGLVATATLATSDTLLATCTGICYQILPGPGQVHCYCRFALWTDGFCNCVEFDSNGEKQCIAYGACSYSW